MNKSFYFFGLLFLGLAAEIEVFSNILYFRIGSQWVSLPSAAKAYPLLLIIACWYVCTMAAHLKLRREIDCRCATKSSG